MKSEKKETIDYEKLVESMGFEELDPFDKNTLIQLIEKGSISFFYDDYPKPPEKKLKGYAERETLYYLIEILKYQLKTSTKCDTLIEQNNQIIELLQKIADK